MASSDFVAHTATARNKDWDVAIPAKAVGHVMLKHAGDVDCFCRFHPNIDWVDFGGAVESETVVQTDAWIAE